MSGMPIAPIVTPVSTSIGLSRKWLTAILIAAALSFAGKVVIASRTYGSTDALYWEANLRELRVAGPVALYEKGTVLHHAGGAFYAHEVFNHPPLMVHLLSLGGWISEKTRIPFRFWLRLTCALADLSSAILLLGILRDSSLPVSPVALFLVAASPISLMVSGFHGNTDPIMMALLVLTVYLTQRGPSSLAGAVLGLAAGIKIVPLLFAPALALSLPGKKRAVFVAGAIGMFFVESLPLVIEHPGLIWSHVFGYSPQTGVWGIPRLVTAFGTEAQARAFAYVARGGLLLVLGAVSIWLHARRPHKPLVMQCGLLALLLLSLAPGFGVQYLAWLVPWACLLSWKQAVAFHGSGGLFLAWFYTRAAHGFPWYLANTATTQVWYGSLFFVGLLCWLVISCLTISLFRRVAKNES